jgi:hypothetical protein
MLQRETPRVDGVPRSDRRRLMVTVMADRPNSVIAGIFALHDLIWSRVGTDAERMAASEPRPAA